MARSDRLTSLNSPKLVRSAPSTKQSKDRRTLSRSYDFNQRDQFLKLIVRDAIAGEDWISKHTAVMLFNDITPEEVRVRVQQEKARCEMPDEKHDFQHFLFQQNQSPKQLPPVGEPAASRHANNTSPAISGATSNPALPKADHPATSTDSTQHPSIPDQLKNRAGMRDRILNALAEASLDGQCNSLALSTMRRFAITSEELQQKIETLRATRNGGMARLENSLPSVKFSVSDQPAPAKPNTYTAHTMMLEIIVRQAQTVPQWQEFLYGTMQANGITAQQVEEELRRRELKAASESTATTSTQPAAIASGQPLDNAQNVNTAAAGQPEGIFAPTDAIPVPLQATATQLQAVSAPAEATSPSAEPISTTGDGTSILPSSTAAEAIPLIPATPATVFYTSQPDTAGQSAMVGQTNEFPMFSSMRIPIRASIGEVQPAIKPTAATPVSEESPAARTAKDTAELRQQRPHQPFFDTTAAARRTAPGVYGAGVRNAFIRLIVRTAAVDPSWRDKFARVMEANRITAEDILAEMGTDELPEAAEQQAEPVHTTEAAGVVDNATVNLASLPPQLEREDTPVSEVEQKSVTTNFRQLTLEVIAKQAVRGLPWQYTCQSLMRNYDITPDEVEQTAAKLKLSTCAQDTTLTLRTDGSNANTSPAAKKQSESSGTLAVTVPKDSPLADSVVDHIDAEPVRAEVELLAAESDASGIAESDVEDLDRASQLLSDVQSSESSLLAPINASASELNAPTAGYPVEDGPLEHPPQGDLIAQPMLASANGTSIAQSVKQALNSKFTGCTAESVQNDHAIAQTTECDPSSAPAAFTAKSVPGDAPAAITAAPAPSEAPAPSTAAPAPSIAPSPFTAAPVPSHAPAALTAESVPSNAAALTAESVPSNAPAALPAESVPSNAPSPFTAAPVPSHAPAALTAESVPSNAPAKQAAGADPGEALTTQLVESDSDNSLFAEVSDAGLNTEPSVLSPASTEGMHEIPTVKTQSLNQLFSAHYQECFKREMMKMIIKRALNNPNWIGSCQRAMKMAGITQTEVEQELALL